MDENWRTIQIFLGKDLGQDGAPRIYEVSISAESSSEVRCTCEVYEQIGYCPHSLKVTKRIEKNNGSFGLVVPENLPTELAFEAFSSAESSRDFVIKYGKIELS